MCIFLGQKSIVYGETFLKNFKFYAKILTKLHDLTVAIQIRTKMSWTPTLVVPFISHTHSVADPHPGSGAFLTLGSGIQKRFFPNPESRIPDLGSQIPNPYV
jgi:hypothetical protein